MNMPVGNQPTDKGQSFCVCERVTGGGGGAGCILCTFCFMNTEDFCNASSRTGANVFERRLKSPQHRPFRTNHMRSNLGPWKHGANPLAKIHRTSDAYFESYITKLLT